MIPILEGERLLYNIQVILIILFITSIFGYIFSTLKEKLYLKNNIILIEKKVVTQEHLNDTDMKEFIIDGLKVKSGDEIKLITKENKSYIGILIGAKKKDKEILIVTHNDEIKNVKVENILKFKIVSKYGRFFN
jgi:hypothetical protein